mmetsp:Transcript_33971/g.106478  ORF Transcript_33971/g.106478 Transcript_33971/m.106478 type:complete len:224 (-) Transcript_33971:92-763(-)
MSTTFQLSNFPRAIIQHRIENPRNDLPDEANDRQISLFPRRKQGEVELPKKGRPPLTIDMSVIESMYTIPQVEACKILGISLTAMKQLCRKLGLDRWPYRRPCTKGRSRIRRKKVPMVFQEQQETAENIIHGETRYAALVQNPSNSSEDEYTEIEGQSDMDSMASTLASLTSTSEHFGIEKDHQDSSNLEEEGGGTDFSFLMDGSLCMDVLLRNLRASSNWNH